MRAIGHRSGGPFNSIDTTSRIDDSCNQWLKDASSSTSPFTEALSELLGGLVLRCYECHEQDTKRQPGPDTL